MMFESVHKFMDQLFKRHSTYVSLTQEDAAIEQFFTDNEYPRQVFEELISTKSPSKHILVIHGIGSVGKSTLLIMYQLSCLRHRIPVGAARGEDALSAVDVLGNWASDLKKNSINFPTFQGTLAHYESLQS